MISETGSKPVLTALRTGFRSFSDSGHHALEAPLPKSALSRREQLHHKSRKLLSFYTNHHRIWADERFDAHLCKARLPDPLHALPAREVEALPCLNQHVQTHQQPKGIAPTVIVDDRDRR